MPSSRTIPLVTGGTSFKEREVPGFLVTDLHFPAGLTLPAHDHDRASLAIMLEGSFDLFMLRRSLPCPPSTVIVEPAGESHGNRVGVKGARVLVVQPQPHHADMPRPCRSLLDTASHGCNQRLTHLARSISRELSAPDAVSGLAIEGLVCEMLAHAARARVAYTPARRPPAWLRRIEEMLQERAPTALSLRELGEAAGVHPVHLARVFRSHHGMTPAEYARELRLSWAAARLAASDASVCDIAAQAGFADQSHFGRTFRRRTGMTPLQYRHSRS